MAVTPTSLRTAFPEFVSASDAIVGAKIAEATLRVDIGIYDANKVDLVTSYLAAHLLALSPFGRTAKLVSDDGSTEYGATYDRMKNAAAVGPRVT